MKELYDPLLNVALSNYEINSKGCHIYQGSKDKDGYPQYVLGNKENAKCYRLHRLILARKSDKAYEELNLACHTCDNPSCINPDHIFEGTYKDNNRDSASKGRTYGQQFLECPQGHPYNEENIYRRPDNPNKRDCKICRKERTRDWFRRNKKEITQ